MSGTFAYTVTETFPLVGGGHRMAYGTYTASGGSTGGAITTGLQTLQSVAVTASGATIVADAPTVNSTLPTQTGIFTVITTASKAGYWQAIGI